MAAKPGRINREVDAIRGAARMHVAPYSGTVYEVSIRCADCSRVESSASLRSRWWALVGLVKILRKQRWNIEKRLCRHCDATHTLFMPKGDQ